MSTKTTLKRIALVAVSALGFGLLSVAPSSAATYAGTLTAQPTKATVTAWLDAADGTNGIFGIQCLQAVVTGASACSGSAGGYVKVGFQPALADSATTFTVTVTGATIVGAAVSDNSSAEDVGYKNGLNFNDGVTVKTNAAGDAAIGQADIQMTRSTAGTSTISFSSVNATTGVATVGYTATITWVDATSLGISTANSTVWVAAGATGSAQTAISAYPTSATDFAAVVHTLNGSRTVSAGGAAVAYAYVTLKDTLGNAINGKSLSATVSGPGMLAGVAGTGTFSTDKSSLDAAARTRSLSMSGLTTLASANTALIGVYSDGTSGVGTVTISQGTTVLRTFDVSFYRAGVPSTIVATANYDTITYTTSANGGAADAGVVTLSIKDAAGVPVEGLSPVQSAASAAADLSGPITAWTCSERDRDIYPGTYWCTPTTNGTSGGSAVYGTVKAAFADNAVAASAFATSNEVSVKVARASITNMTVALDKKEYAPGEKATLTITATDASGNAVSDVGTYTSIFTTSSNLSTSATLPTGLTASTRTVKNLVGGKQTFTLYAPTIAGDWILSVVTNSSATTGLATAALGKTFTATATVTAGSAEKAADAATDAANEAIDAANAATDAANLAAEAADAATVAAEEARDAADAATAAVEELATQVATLMAALKAQITTLANTVAKIAKKVKA